MCCIVRACSQGSDSICETLDLIAPHHGHWARSTKVQPLSWCSCSCSSFPLSHLNMTTSRGRPRIIHIILRFVCWLLSLLVFRLDPLIQYFDDASPIKSFLLDDNETSRKGGLAQLKSQSKRNRAPTQSPPCQVEAGKLIAHCTIDISPARNSIPPPTHVLGFVISDPPAVVRAVGCILREGRIEPWWK